MSGCVPTWRSAAQSVGQRAARYALTLLVLCSLVAVGGCQLEPMLCIMTGGTWHRTQFTSGSVPIWEHCAYPPSKSASASVGEALLLPATAHVAGELGTTWRSDVEIHCFGDEPATVSLWLLVHGADNSTPVSRNLTIEPGRSRRLGDVLASEFGVEGQAALLVAPSAGRIVLTSRTYNLLGEGNALGLPAGATFGQFIPALGLTEAIHYGEQGRLIQLSHSTAASGGFRTNLGLVNPSAARLEVEVDLFTAAGALLGRVPVVLPPLGYRQLNRVFALVSADDVPDGYAVVRPTTWGGMVFAYASVVDNLTGDPVAIPAARLPLSAPPTAGDPVYVVAAAHVRGAADTDWRTDVEVHCWSDGPASFTVELLAHGADNSDPPSHVVHLGAGESYRFEDILASVFAFEGQAALRFAPSSGRILVTSRTYNLLAAGNAMGLPAGATFGQFIPGVTVDRAIHFGEDGRLVQLAHQLDGASGFRTNLVLVNATAASIAVEVELFTSRGGALGSLTRTLAPYEYRQLNRVFALATSDDVPDGYAVVRTTSEGGSLFALASVVDNLTGDPVGMGAAVILPAGEGEVVDQVAGAMEGLGQTTIDELVGQIQSLGPTGVLDGFVAAWPEVAERTAEGLVIDYGAGYQAEDGSTWSGSTTVDVSGLAATAAGLTGTMTITHDDLLVDGEAPIVGSTAWTVDLIRRDDGTVAGEVAAGPAASWPKSAGALTASLLVDTAVCPRYPIGGTIKIESETTVLTITLSSSCHPGFVRSIEPAPSAGAGDLLGLEWSFKTLSSAVGTIDSSTGEWRYLGDSGFGRLNSLARSATGTFFSVTEDVVCGRSSLITIDPRTGAGTLVGALAGLPDDNYVAGLAVAPDGTLVAAVGQCNDALPPDDELYHVDPASGRATRVATMTGRIGVGSLDFDPTTGTLYGWDYQNGLITIDPHSGLTSDVDGAVVGPNMTALVIRPDGTMVGGQHELYAIDKATGEATRIGDSSLSNVRGIELLDAR